MEISVWNCSLSIENICMKLVQYNGYIPNTVDTDYLVLEQQGISWFSAEYASMHYLLNITLVFVRCHCTHLSNINVI